jgi:hypothetical protein
VELAMPRAANQIMDIQIGSATAAGLREQSTLPVL